MKNSVLTILLALALVIASIGYYFYPPAEKPILGRALVLMFVADSQNQSNLLNQWEKLDLSVAFSNGCVIDDVIRRRACVSQQINNAFIRTQQVNKPLLVLADKGVSQAVLATLKESDANQISALILLQAEADESLIEDVVVPKTLVISDLNDLAENISATRLLASNIRKNDQWVWSTMLVDSGEGLLSHPVLPHMVSYLIKGQMNPAYLVEFNAESQWQNPIVNNSKFFENNELVETRPVDNDIHRTLKAFYAYDHNLLKQWPLEKYKAFNLLKYRNQLPENERGRFAIFSNRKGHKFYLDMQRYGQYIPEFVIAIDDEENLYRMTSFYRTKRYYSWEQGGPNEDMLYSQSLGAFIHFQKSPPAHMELPYLQYSSILFESIKFTDQDPYVEIDGLSGPAFEVLTLNCIPCHRVNGVGGGAHHLDYLTVKPQPGFAQPLLSYSKDVLDNFFFNQTATAKLIGVNPNYVEIKIGEELITWFLLQSK